MINQKIVIDLILSVHFKESQLLINPKILTVSSLIVIVSYIIFLLQ